VSLGLSVDLRGYKRGMQEIVEKQIPFATAKALTLTAKDAQAELRGNLGKHFTVRNKHLARGIRIKSAKKRDAPNIYAEVGSIDAFVVKQAESSGTTEIKPAGGRRFVPVPVRVRRSKRQIVRRSKFPAKLLKRPRHAFFDGHRRDRVGLARYKGRAGAQTLSLQWWLVDRTKVRGRWPFLRTVTKVAKRKAPEHLARELEKAAADTIRRNERKAGRGPRLRR